MFFYIKTQTYCESPADFAYGWSKANPDSEGIEQTVAKPQLRNFPSVEQNPRQPGKFFIVKIKSGLVPALDLTKVFKLGREPQGEIN